MRAIGFQPSALGRTRSKKRTSVSWSSGLVANVTASHTSVVTGTVTSRICAVALGPVKTLKSVNAFDTTADATSAEISLQAFTRHQYQRRIMTSPTPAVRLKRYIQALPTEVIV